MIIARATTPALVFAMSLSCAASSSQPNAETETPHPTAVHARPSERAMTRAFERVREDAVRCLRAGDRVSVRGSFVGSDGRYAVERIEANGGSLPYAVETCVRVAAEHAHVRAFTDERVAYAGSFEGAAPAAVTTTPATTATSSTATSTTATTTNAVATGSMTIGSRPAPVESIRREADALQRCYEQACERDHTVAGHVELHLALDAAGHIARLTSRVDTTHEDVTLMELVAHCIESHVRLIQFGPQQYPGQEIVVPLTFQPGGIPID